MAPQPRRVRVQRAFQRAACGLLLLASACRPTRPNPILGRWASDPDRSAPICTVFVEDIEFLKDGTFIVSSGRGQYRLLEGNRVRLHHTSQMVWGYQVSGNTLTLQLVSGLEKQLKGARCSFQRAK